MTLDQLLNVFWLRPETALWREIDIRAMEGFEFEGKSLDFGCGDGIFSFIRAAGEFEEKFDAYQSVSNLDKFFENIDVHDSSEKFVAPVVIKKPSSQISIGFDQKENLLKKASALGLYGDLVCGDGNKKLPFEDNEFNSIFSNIVYWLDHPERVIEELARILAPGGKICLMLPNITLPQFSFYGKLFGQEKNQKWAFLEKLDRGRFSSNIKHARSSSDWEEMFKQASLSIHTHRRHLSGNTIKIWDIGLRPLFPVLLKMKNAINQEELVAIKVEWNQILKQFILPLSEMDCESEDKAEYGFHCYVLEKTNV